MGRYSEEVVKKASERRNLAVGFYKFKCVQAMRQPPNEESGNMRGMFVWAPLKKDGSEGRPTVRDYMTYPLRNEKFPGHQEPNTTGLTVPVVQAAFPKECPLYPRTDKDTKKLMYKGKVISKDEEESAREEAGRAALDKLDALELDPTPMVGKEVYAKITYEDGNDFPKMRNFCVELPAGTTLVPEDQWMAAVKTGGSKKDSLPAAKSSSGGGKKKSKFSR
jgi:hypothetical protein